MFFNEKSLFCARLNRNKHLMLCSLNFLSVLSFNYSVATNSFL